MEFLKNLFSSEGFIPHGHCLLWKPDLVWLHIVSDSIITLSYYSIPIMLVYLARKRQDLAFQWMFLMFGAFILGCGTTHLMGIWTLWIPTYWLDGGIKLATAVFSIVTAVLLVPIVPKVLAMRTPAELETINRELETQIAERKRIEAELARSNAELEQFASVASHDLQEPLRKVLAFGDRLKAKYDELLDDEGRDYLKRMENASKRMQILINDLLTLSRVTTKGNPFIPVNLTDVVQQVLSDLEIRIQQTGGRVEVDNLPTIDADPTQIHLLMQNLIGNALKYHREEEAPVIKIKSKPLNGQEQGWADRPSGNGLRQIIVEDNGIGFDEKYLDRIFIPFQRLHSRGHYEGTGIGLAICRKVAERHGGSITAKSTPGKGTTFIVTLPIKHFNN
jgi:signal transduction histidine kinase